MRYFLKALTLLICLVFCSRTHSEVAPTNQVLPLTLKVTPHRLSDIPISKYIFGNFVELGFGRQGSGMWAEMLFNRSFQPVTPYKSSTWEWLGVGPQLYNDHAPFWHSGYEENDWELLDPEHSAKGRGFGTDTFKGDGSLWLDNFGTNSVGLRQHGIYLQAGRKYNFGLFGGFAGPKISAGLNGYEIASKSGLETRIVTVRFRNEARPDEVLFARDLELGTLQQEHDLTFQLPDFTGRATLEIVFTWKGRLLLSCSSLMPHDNVRGWKAEVVAALKRAAPPVIRFPGGCFASFYDWRAGVGPRNARQATESYYWGGLEENDIGVDEFLDLCNEIHCEPQLCVNLMTGTPFKAAELVEYCNGSNGSAMGRFRMENGVTRGCHVTYWEMDNEAGRKWSAIQYAQKVAEFAQAMRRVDPTIKIMMEYYSYGPEWLPQMLEIAGPHIDCVIHRNGSPEFVRPAVLALRDYNRKHGTSIRQVDTEWLPDTTSPGPLADPDVPQQYGWDGRIRNNYKKTLSYREGTWFYALNAADRLLDYLSYGGEFHLANFNNCVNTWGQNIIESSKEKVWLSPSGRAFEFFTAGFDGKYPLATKLPDDAGAVPLLKAQACETGAGGIVIYVVNLARETQTLRMALPPGYHAISGETLFAPDRLTRITQQKCEIQNGKITSAANGDWMLPPLSVTKLKAEK